MALACRPALCSSACVLGDSFRFFIDFTPHTCEFRRSGAGLYDIREKLAFFRPEAYFLFAFSEKHARMKTH